MHPFASPHIKVSLRFALERKKTIAGEKMLLLELLQLQGKHRTSLNTLMSFGSARKQRSSMAATGETATKWAKDKNSPNSCCQPRWARRKRIVSFNSRAWPTSSFISHHIDKKFTSLRYILNLHNIFSY